MTLNPLSVIAITLALLSSVTVTHAQEDTSEQNQRPDHRGDRPPAPDLSNAAEQLGISEEDLHSALRASGGPPPDLAKAAEALGISEDELKAVMPEPPRRGRRP
ncbi:MAG: hypothetical protein AAGA89_00720 [Pseudomonadota bacterium]